MLYSFTPESIGEYSIILKEPTFFIYFTIHLWLNRKRIIFMRIITYFLVVFLHISYCYSQTKLSELVQRCKPSIIVINTYDKDGKRISLGTGFFIDPKGIALSNYHVFAGAKTATITTYDGNKYFVNNIIAQSKEMDIIKFSISFPQQKAFPYLPLAQTNPKEGEDVFVIGNPQGLEYSVSNGIVSSLRYDEKMGQTIQTTTPISKGNSGSPLINMNGEVLGIISFFLTEGQNLNFAISIGNLFSLTEVNELVFPKGQSKENWMTNKLDEIYNVREQFVFHSKDISTIINDKKDSEQKEQAIILFNFSDSLYYQSDVGNMRVRSEVYEPWKKTMINGDWYWRLCLKYFEGDKYNLIFFYIYIDSEQKTTDSELQSLHFFSGKAEWHITKEPSIIMRYIGIFMITDKFHKYLLTLK